jgi:hypothetical protein
MDSNLLRTSECAGGANECVSVAIRGRIPILPELQQCKYRNSRPERPMQEAKMMLMEVIEDERGS